MPGRIVTADRTRFWITEFELPSLQADEIRVRVSFAAPKHGAESQLITGSAFQTKQWDPELRLFLPLPETPAYAGKVGRVPDPFETEKRSKLPSR